MIHASHSPLREIHCSCTSRESQITLAVRQMNIHKNPGIAWTGFVILLLVRRHSQVHPKFSPALRWVPKLITITPKVLLYEVSEIPVTPKAGRNALLGSDTLLKLTLLSLLSTSSQKLLETPSDKNTFCWCQQARLRPRSASPNSLG